MRISQHFINASDETILEGVWGIEVGEILAGVHTGVCTPATCNLSRLVKNCRKYRLDLFLYADLMRLFLPAEIIGSIISQASEIPHCYSRLSGL